MKNKCYVCGRSGEELQSFDMTDRRPICFGCYSILVNEMREDYKEGEKA